MPWHPYLALAKVARIGGDVEIEATVAQDGTISELRVISGHPFLIPAAMEYMKECHRKPLYIDERVETFRIPFYGFVARDPR
jgi:outer membrane biosynthesis protein TonB